jgi:hypothetical protein
LSSSVWHLKEKGNNQLQTWKCTQCDTVSTDTVRQLLCSTLCDTVSTDSQAAVSCYVALYVPRQKQQQES